MRKKVMLGIIVFLVLASAVLAVSYTREEKKLINDCRVDCRDTRKSDINFCKEQYTECKNICTVDYEECKQEQKQYYDECKNQCSLEYNYEDPSLDRYQSRAVKYELRKCNSVCYKEYRVNRKKLCKINDCRKECSTERKDCFKDASNDYRSSRKNCIYTVFDDNITCEDGKYKAGEIFLEGCSICECNYDTSISCEISKTCNFENVVVDEELCEEANGYYHNLCKGPYFRLRCSKNKYCQCAGDQGYECPENYVCVMQFKDSTIPRSTTDDGYKDNKGLPIGEIGICAEKPQLDNCGNGICENIVCEGCQAETKFNCPEDC